MRHLHHVRPEPVPVAADERALGFGLGVAGQQEAGGAVAELEHDGAVVGVVRVLPALEHVDAGGRGDAEGVAGRLRAVGDAAGVKRGEERVAERAGWAVAIVHDAPDIHTVD